MSGEKKQFNQPGAALKPNIEGDFRNILKND
jgi:hypothetical protein